ncbi:MAG: 3-deoxy-8-phosphooctulonate synthase [Deltaproteobacteria bacterium]|jgi:2-dehydro-3-deoxyphosphooctonate aldolase (KDO 8-P synthase)|nr:3-deoxy-8-phosphooctulonate synthase [Deltaproteobacteria bacterium]
MDKQISLKGFTIEKNRPFFAIAGPCVIENEATTLQIATFLKKTSQDMNIPIIFKASFDKANRTSLNSFRGPGIDKGLKILQKVKDETGLLILSDVHDPNQAKMAAKVLDIIQIPALLCRQTDLLIAAAETGLPVNIKKGQFLSPAEMEPAIQKITATGNNNILITERGTFFGYNNIVVDIRSIASIKLLGFPVIFDATHSVQLPGGSGTSSGGQREFVECLSKAAVAAGANGIFMEIHPDPDSALCDGPNSLPFEQVSPLLALLREIHDLVNHDI